MIHPAFAEIGEPTIAAVCSEAFDVDNAYAFATDPDIITRYGDSAFPPVPARLAGVTVAFLEETGARATFAPVHATQEDIPEIVRLYSKTVGNLQSDIPALDALAVPVQALGGSFEGMRQLSMKRVASINKRLLAAHVIVRTVESGELIDTLVVLRMIGQELPMILRDTYARAAHLRTDIPETDQAAFENILGPLFRREEVVQKVGDIVAASFLPTEARFKSSFGYTGHEGSPATP